MAFYFVVHFLIGLMAGNAAWVLNRISPLERPYWVGSLFGAFIGIVTLAAIPVALVTTFINFSFMWSLATAGEILLGLFLAGLIPGMLKFLLMLLSPIALIVIFGSLWGW